MTNLTEAQWEYLRQLDDFGLFNAEGLTFASLQVNRGQMGLVKPFRQITEDSLINKGILKKNNEGLLQITLNGHWVYERG